MPPSVRTYRWLVLLLAAAFFVDRALTEDFTDLSDFGWQFRYLTIWALTGSLVAAALMLTPRFGAPDARGAVFVSVVAVLNMIVVVSYWRLYFDDPALVNGENAIVPLREYYLHLAGPLLQWIDVLSIKRGFRRMGAVALWLGVLVLAYLGWAELIVAPLNDGPVGTVTAGLPYPFLNDMGLGARLGFYGATWASGLVFIALLRAAQAGVDRLAPRGGRTA
ncbi:androgen-induced gene 1 family protein [Meridianimarinicoccus roseus]|nr:androgen-induced gene 1 family protein [Meridianimarinicoccus roseus]